MKKDPVRYALFSGCAVEHTGGSARRATIALARVLGIELWEAPPRGCCGARADRPAGEKALRDLSAPLAEATSQGLAIACLSPGCRQVIASQLRPINQGKPAAESVPVPPNVMDLVQLLTREDDPDRLTGSLVRSLSPLRIALHGTCHGDHNRSAGPTRQQSKLSGTSPTTKEIDKAAEHPAPPPTARTLADLVAETGAEPREDVSIAGRCAATPLLPAPAGKQPVAPPCLVEAARLGIDLLVTPCFLCFGTLNDRQRGLGRDDPARSVPVLHLAQLLGMACGAPPLELELGHITARARPVLAPFAV